MARAWLRLGSLVIKYFFFQMSSLGPNDQCQWQWLIVWAYGFFKIIYSLLCSITFIFKIVKLHIIIVTVALAIGLHYLNCHFTLFSACFKFTKRWLFPLLLLLTHWHIYKRFILDYFIYISIKLVWAAW